MAPPLESPKNTATSSRWRAGGRGSGCPESEIPHLQDGGDEERFVDTVGMTGRLSAPLTANKATAEKQRETRV